MYDKFDKQKPFALLDTSKYPPEVAGRFNSFITTQFDDSLSVEMQMRSIIKWAIDNFKEMDQTYNDFTEYVIQGNLNPFIQFLNDLIEYMNNFIETFDSKLTQNVIVKLNEWLDDGTLADIINNDVFDMKADKTFVDSEIENLTTQLADNISLSKYADNIGRDSYWNTDPTSGVNGAWSDRQVLLLGDSHGWGEGAPNYQGISAGHTLHTPWIHNKGFYGRLMDYLYKKWDSEPWRVIPLQDKNDPIPKSAIGAVPLNGAYTDKYYEDKYTFTMSPRIVAGKYYISTDKASENNSANNTYIDINADADTREDHYAIENYRHNTRIGLFGENVLVLTNDDLGESAVLFDMKKPSRYAQIQLGSGSGFYGKAVISLLDPSIRNADGSENWEQNSSGFGSVDYGTATPKVYVRKTINNTAPLVEPPNATVVGNVIEIDCSYTGMNNQADYFIDFGQKKIGTLKVSYGGAGVNTANVNTILGEPTINTRGVIFGNRDIVKNWSMGGHTIGAWLGLESSFSNETRNHVADIKAYLTGQPKALIIEAPLVNEWLKQTSIADFKTRLSTLLTEFNCSNVLIFTTLGLKNREYGTDEKAVKFEDYAQATKDWATEQSGEVTFIDCRAYLKNLVSRGVIADYNDLWINNGHPSPLSNEMMYEMLKKVVDLKL